jgi:hypothetical protein
MAGWVDEDDERDSTAPGIPSGFDNGYIISDIDMKEKFCSPEIRAANLATSADPTLTLVSQLVPTIGDFLAR